ncbi:MAG: heavy metal translocating P-type ATPase [Planctomycetota bacterium]
MSLAAAPGIDSHATTRCPCTHCSLPVPGGLIEHDAEDQFCCNACKVAHSVITASGLSGYYRVREHLADDASGPSTGVGAEFAEFDDAAFVEQHVIRSPNGEAVCDLYLEGVRCAACVWLVERLPRIVPGTREARLDLGRSLVRITWNDSVTRLSAIARILDRLGYRPHAATGAAQRSARRSADRRAMIQLAVAGACMGNIMLLAAALYSGMLDGMDETTRHGFRLLSACFGLVAVLWPGRVFFRGAFTAVRARVWHLDMPIALALGVGTFTGVLNAIRGSGEIYFDSVAMLIFLLLAARWLQERGVRSAADSIELLSSCMAPTAHRVESEGVRDIPSNALSVGDTVEVRPGESCPVDGCITSGSSHFDTSVLTGEPRPVAAQLGDRINAGAVNTNATVHIRAEAIGYNTRVGQIMETIGRLSRERIPFLGRADRIAGPFFFAVLLLAGLTLTLWLPQGLTPAFEHTTALLIVVCPCALALATPLVCASAIGQAARSGLLIKGADVFERLGAPGTAFLDKTGTLTHGAFKIVDATVSPALLAAAAALERHSSHPIAKTFEPFDQGAIASRVQHHTGLGVHGTVDGRAVAIGRRSFVESTLGVHLPAEATDWHGTLVYIADEAGDHGVVQLGDTLRTEAAGLIRTLRSQGWAVRILSGDSCAAVEAVAAQLEIPPHEAAGSMTPESKLQAVELALDDGPVMMIGDGVNDASALARATVGIATHGGAEASLTAADVYLTENRLQNVSTLLLGSRAVIRSIRLCLAVSLTYNVIAATLAIGGIITPLFAAILMPVSSLTVIWLSLSRRHFMRSDPRP